MQSLRDKQFIEAFKALADPARLRILRLLKQKGHCSLGKDDGMCARDIEERIKLSQSTISHHMSILKKAGLVRAEKQGLWMWYRRNDQALRQLAAALNDV